MYDHKLQPLSSSRSLKRAVFYLISTTFSGIGHLFILFTKNKQAFHDLLAKTVVIHKSEKPPRYEFLILIAIVGACFLQLAPSYILNEKTIKAYRIPTGSKPTILVSDYILADKSGKSRRIIKRGDMIIFKFPPNEAVEYVSRCVAVGGQTVEIRDRELFINGQPEGEMKFISNEFDEEENRSINNYKVKKANGSYYSVPQDEMHPLR